MNSLIENPQQADVITLSCVKDNEQKPFVNTLKLRHPTISLHTLLVIFTRSTARSTIGYSDSAVAVSTTHTTTARAQATARTTAGARIT